MRNDGVDEYNSIIIAKKEQLKRLVIFLSYRKKRRQRDAFPHEACVGQMSVKSFTLFSESQTR